MEPTIILLENVEHCGGEPGLLEGGLHEYVVCMHACIGMYAKGGLGACSPSKCLEIKCSEIASETILIGTEAEP